MLRKILFLAVAVIFTNIVSGEVLIYKWRNTGSELYSPTGSTQENNVKVRQKGYLVVGYDTATGVYSTPKLLIYWKDKDTKIKYYTEQDFILGIAQFETLTTEKNKYQTMYGFYGGVNGEYYSGKTKATKLKKGGDKYEVSKRLSGTSNWKKIFTSDATTNGSSKVKLSLSTSLTKQVNDDVNPLDVDGAIEFILNEKLNGYTKTDEADIILNGQIFESVDINSGTIDGTVIGGEVPAAGTFTDLASDNFTANVINAGQDGTSGQINIHSEQGATDYTVSFNPSGIMTQDTTYYLPSNYGDSNNVLTTDGNGVLSWKPVSEAGTVAWANVIKTGSSLGDLETRSAGDLSSGNLDVARLPAGGSWTLTSDLDFDNNTLTIDQANNRIGIGTASPTATLTVIGKTTNSSGNFATTSDAQCSKIVLRNQTTDATQTELFINGTDERLVMPANTTWTYFITVAAKQANANTGAGYVVEGAIIRDGSNNTSIIAASGVTSYGGGTFGGVTVNADDTNESLRILVTGAASTSIRWVATVQITEVSTD